MANFQSNFDRRRINGPEESFQPLYDEQEEEELAKTRWKVGQQRVGRGQSDAGETGGLRGRDVLWA